MIDGMSVNNSGGGRRLSRPKDGRMLAGVCAGLAAYFAVDANLVRLMFGVFTFFWGLGALVYMFAWAILPEEGEDASIVETFVGKYRK
jgi:phage shock protein PspC (stress-responsive transcriptional regulator)